jgi:hypothetical protein
MGRGEVKVRGSISLNVERRSDPALDRVQTVHYMRHTIPDIAEVGAEDERFANAWDSGDLVTRPIVHNQLDCYHWGIYTFPRSFLAGVPHMKHHHLT